ncbi:MAG: response regulator [Pseudomonadota bacterium]
MATILIVDDDSSVADVVALVLDGEGHRTDTASDATETLKKLSQGGIQGVILDVWLGADDGLALADKLAQLNEPPPFIVMSGGGPGRSLETVTARADALGARAVLYKPFDDDELIAAVNDLLGL